MSALSPLDLNRAWLQGLMDVAFLNPLRDPMATCPFDPDSDLAELWHYGAQWAMKKEGVDIHWKGEDGKEKPPAMDIEGEIEKLWLDFKKHENKPRLD